MNLRTRSVIGPKGARIRLEKFHYNPGTRYTREELGGGSLRIVASGDRADMLRLERSLHETLPLGPEERQLFYIQKQVEAGLRPPPYK
jgi:hypothetical protein